ncbi:MAG: hypothetical protein GX158_08450 [Bacteroidales bacterium]|nr:hypothetical protein [Bacteroidales bacterium]
MPRFDFEKLDANLEIQGFSDSQTREKIMNAIRAVPEKTYDKAVVFLGIATLIVALGGIILAAMGKAVPNALWTALGEGVGGLSGSFTGK